MINENKRGQAGIVGKIVAAIFVVFILAFVIIFLVNIGNGTSSAAGTAFQSISDFSSAVLYPFLGFLLNLDNAGSNGFLMVLTFILISIIIVGTLDAVDVFGNQNQGGLINLAIGLIVSIIGVRFMPATIWSSLTTPSSAFVATILVGAPFLALSFITMKIPSRLASKLLWMFYVIFMSWLIFAPNHINAGIFKWIYSGFLLSGVLMMAFDASVRKFLRKEKEGQQYEELLNGLDIQKRQKIRDSVIKWNTILEPTSGASKADISTAKRELTKLRQAYGQNLSDI